jgi:hypothetical protein
VPLLPTDLKPLLPEPRLPADKFHVTLQHPLATPAPSDGAHTPNNLRQPDLVQNMPINPRWLHPHGDRIGLVVSPYVGGGAMPSPGPQSHITPAEVGNNDQTTNPFDLDFIASPGHMVCGVDSLVPIM